MQRISPGCSSPFTLTRETPTCRGQGAPLGFITAISSFSPSIILLLQLSGASSIRAIVHTGHKALAGVFPVLFKQHWGCKGRQLKFDLRLYRNTCKAGRGISPQKFHVTGNGSASGSSPWKCRKMTPRQQTGYKACVELCAHQPDGCYPASHREGSVRYGLKDRNTRMKRWCKS